MSAKLEIDVRLRTDEAASNADKLKNDLNEVKTVANTPAKVRVDTTDAQKRITDIKTALREVQLAPGLQSAVGGALQEISQEARTLTADMTGAKKSVADLGISMGLAAANALGPWGQFIAGVAGAIGMIQRLEREQVQRINQERQVQDVIIQTGLSYRALTGNIQGATTAEQQRQAVMAAGLRLLDAQAQLLNQGFSTTQIQSFTRQLESMRSGLVRTSMGVTQNVSVNDVLGAVASKNAGFFRQMGVNIEFSNNQQLNAARVQAALTQRVQGHTAAVLNGARAAQQRARSEDLIFTATSTRMSMGEEAYEQRLAQLRNNLQMRTMEVTAAENANTAAVAQAKQARNQLTEAERTAAQVRTTAPRAAAGAAAANRATAEQLREARRRIFEVAAETQFDERMRVMRAGTDERERATQQFRNLVAEETYRHQQSMRSVQLGQLEQDLTRTRRQALENEAQRLQRLAETRARYNQVRREALEAEDAEATRKRELREQERTQAMETANAVRAAFDLQLQGRQELIAAEEAQRQARTALGNASLTQQQQEAAAFRQANDSLPAIRAQIDIINQRIAAAREHAASETEINRLIIERMGLETQAINVQAQAAAARQRSIPAVINYKDAMVESGASITDAMTKAAGAAIFAGENVGEALQAALASTLQNIAIESAVKALFETGKGLAALALGNPGAALHFAAAGKFAATAVVAGAAGAVAAPEKAGATATGTAPAPAAAPRAETPTRRESEEGGGAKNIFINLNAFQSNEQAQNLIVRSLREAGYNGRDATIRR